MQEFKDHFSAVASDYSRFRPSYPPQLFAWLASLSPSHDLAWDAGCGNGQAALALAPHFRRIVATDASSAQIARATPHERIDYRIAPAEDSGLPAAGVALAVVAQALHWFDLDRFYAEVRRVVRPGGVLAAFAYGLLAAGPPLDAVLHRLYFEIVAPFWPPERHYIEAGYADLPFPFAELPSPSYTIEAEWTLDHLTGYLGTWSAVRMYREERGEDPVALLGEELRRAWGEPRHPRLVVWPIHLRVGRI